MATILLVEDDSPLLTLYASVIAESHTVLTATCARDALNLLRDHRPDVLLLDLNLPDAPGTSILKVVQGRSCYADMRVVVMTGFSKLRGREMPPCVVERLAKPVTAMALLRTIEAVLAQPQPSR